MAASSLSLSLASTAISSNRLNVPNLLVSVPRPSASSITTCAVDTNFTIEERSSRRKAVVLGLGALGLSLFPANPIFAEDIPKNYDSFVDLKDGYSYIYPSDWVDFDFRGHDSAFKDRYLQLQNVRLSFIPTENKNIHDLGPVGEVVFKLVNHVYSAPNQVAKVFDLQERNIDGKSYCTFEYTLTSKNFSRAAFATIAIANGRYYTLIVGANERRWRRVRDKLKLVADSFRVLDI